MTTLYFGLAALAVGALSCIALGIAEFNSGWLWDVRVRFQDAHILSWLEYARMWHAYFWHAILDPAALCILALPVGAMVLLHRWPKAQAGLLVMLVAFLANDVRLLLTLELGSPSRCRACDLSLIYHALLGVLAILVSLVGQACYWAWRLSEQTFRPFPGWNPPR